MVFVAAVMFTALRNWYFAICGLLFLTVFAQHPSMPTGILDIPGANPWNATLAVIVLGFLSQRSREPRGAPTPLIVKLLAGGYVLMVALSGLITALTPGSIINPYQIGVDFNDLIINGCVNPLKYTLVGFLVYFGANSRERIAAALLSVVGSGLLYAAMMFKSLGARVLSIDFEDARRLTDKLIGLYANDMAELLAFTIWSALAVYCLLPERWMKWACGGGTAMALLPFEALKSRAGFLAFGAAGLMLGVYRWRKLLIILPLGGAIAVLSVADLRDRILTGVSEEGQTNWDAVSAGRMTNIWPACIRQIAQSPIIGHARYSIRRTDCYWDIAAAEGVVPTHPHNSYIEIAMDAGLLGLGICVGSCLGIFWAATRLMRLKADPLMRALGTCGAIAIVCELSAGVAGSSFYATQSKLPYLCTWAMVLRALIELQRRPAAFQKQLEREPARRLGVAQAPALVHP